MMHEGDILSGQQVPKIPNPSLRLIVLSFALTLRYATRIFPPL